MASSDAYRQKQDTISEFIGDKIVKAEGYYLKKTELNFQFTAWHQANYNNKGPNAKEVHAYLDKMFSKYTANGWANLRIKQDINAESEIGSGIDQDDDLDEPVF